MYYPSLLNIVVQRRGKCAAYSHSVVVSVGKCVSVRFKSKVTAFCEGAANLLEAFFGEKAHVRVGVFGTVRDGWLGGAVHGLAAGRADIIAVEGAEGTVGFDGDVGVDEGFLGFGDGGDGVIGLRKG
jgi:hypothetical protein